MKTHSSFIYVTIILFLFLQNTFADEEIEKSFSVSPGGWLKLESDLGSIDVETHNENTVKVKVIKKVRDFWGLRGKKVLDEFEVRFEQKGDDVYVYGELEDWKSDRGSHLNIRYIITVPAKYNLDLHTAGGSISIDDLAGEVLAKTSGGSLDFGNIRGAVTAKTSGGSISTESCIGNSEFKTSGGSISLGDAEGDIEAHTSGGSVTIESVKGDINTTTSGGSIDVHEVMGNINAQTSGGFVKCRITKQPTDNCSLKTSGGSLTIYMKKGTAVDLDAKTSGGRVTSDHAIMIRGEIDKSSLKGKVNGGGPELYLRTSGGGIRLLEI
jgi:hypothetical protein